MSYIVAIRNNATGEVRHCTMEGLEWHQHSMFWWTEGNFGCDCNRRATWASDDQMESCCGQGDFSVLYAELPDGTRISIDCRHQGDDAVAPPSQLG